MFENICSKFAGHTAYISDKNESATYKDLVSFSQKMGTVIKKRSLIFSLCENTSGSFFGYFSFICNQSVPLLLDAKIDQSLLANLIDIYQPNYLWTPSSMAASFEKSKQIFSDFGYSLLTVSEKTVPMNDDLALLLATSGSTGSPKVVRLTYKNIRTNAESIADYLKITEMERPVTTLPMHYSFGLSIINSHLISGATILLTNRTVFEKEFWSFVKERQATSFSGVPYTYEMLHRLRFFRMDLPHLKTLTQAGGRLSPALVQEFSEQSRSAGREFIVMYGQTEATARMSYLPFNKSHDKYGSIGIAIPGGKFKLLDEEGKEIVEHGLDGELVYTGDNVSLGYAEVQSDLAKEDENKGVLHTGDIARRDEDGFYYITGRKKRFVKLYGNRVNLDAMDQLLKGNMSEGEYACSGIDDNLIVYTTSRGKTDSIVNFLSEKTGINRHAFSVKEIVEIPKNSSGKILYAELSKL